MTEELEKAYIAQVEKLEAQIQELTEALEDREAARKEQLRAWSLDRAIELAKVREERDASTLIIAGYAESFIKYVEGGE